jgi:hypothetical protein
LPAYIGPGPAATLALHAKITVSAIDSGWLDAHRGDPAALRNPPPGVVHGRDSGDNVTTTGGLTCFAAALVWSGIQDQAASLGVTAPTFLTPLWGAVGDGSGAASISDTALFSEISRTTVGAGAASPATSSIAALCDWLFFFGPPSSTWTVTEAGAFGLATSTPGSGTLLDHYMLSSPVTVTSPDSALLQVALSVLGS